MARLARVVTMILLVAATGRCEDFDAALARAKAYRATATEIRDGSVVTNWTLAANDLDSARERAREQAARRGFCSDIFVRVERIED